MNPFRGRRLDLYVAWNCLGSWLVCLLFLVGLTIIFDLISNLESMLHNLEAIRQSTGTDYGVSTIFRWYGVWTPFLFEQIGPFVTVTAGMFAVTRLMGNNEIAPMLFCGRSLHRIMLPVFLMGIGTAGIMVGMREYVLPALVEAKDDLFSVLHEGKVELVVEDQLFELVDGNALLVDVLRPKTDQIEGMVLYLREQGGYVQAFVAASHADFKERGERGPGWYLTHGRRTDLGTDVGYDVDFLSTEVHPALHPSSLRKLLKDRRELLDLSYSDLATLVRSQPDLKAYTVYLHYHLTYPLANLVLLILALPFALRFERGSKTERVFFALVVCGAYLITDMVARQLGAKGFLHPVVAPWSPTVLFASLGAVMYDTVRS